VAVAKTGYTITPGSRTVPVYYGETLPLAGTFSTLTADGDPDKATTELTLEFASDIDLTAGDIIFNPGATGAERGTLNGGGKTYKLPVSGIEKEAKVSVTVHKEGYTFTGGPTKSATVYGPGLKQVTDLDLTDYIPAPVDGKTPVSGFVPASSQYTAKNVEWNSAAFNTEKQLYTASVTLDANPNYTFKGWERRRLVHAEAELSGKPDNSGDSLTVFVSFFRPLNPLPTIGGTWYVKTGGSDEEGNTGADKTSPLATIDRALELAKADKGSNGTKYSGDISAHIVLLSDLTLTTKNENGGNRIAAITSEHPPIILSSYTPSEMREIIMTDVSKDQGQPDGLLLVDGGKLTLKDITLAYNDNENSDNDIRYLNVIKVKKDETGNPGYLTFESGVSVLNINPAVNPASNLNFDPLTDLNKFNFACGVYVGEGGVFTMNKGIISGNMNSNEGGGGVYNAGLFTMNGGTIELNSAPGEDGQKGGGVYTSGNGTFIMNGGTIRGNAASFGGGVYNTGSFTMKGGIIAGNGASDGGGVNSSTSFIKTGGVIYGEDAAPGLNNIAAMGTHAVYISDTQNQNKTVWSDNVLNSTLAEE
jgi:hypothetical protein